jgi:hypothetical protein
MIALFVGLLASSALAQDEEPPLTVALSVEGPSGCIDARSLEALVREQVDRTRFVAEAGADLRVRVRFEEREDGFHAVVDAFDRTGGRIGTRTLEERDPDCGELDQSVLLVVALVVDSPGIRERAREVSASVDRLPLVVAAFGGVAIEAAPDVAPIAGLSLTFDLVPYWSLRTELELAYGGTAGSQAGARFYRAGGTLSLCPGVRSGAWIGRLCAGVSGAAVVADGFGFDFNESAVRAAVDARAGVFAAFVERALALEIGVSLGVPIIRDRFVFTEPPATTTALYEPFPVYVVVTAAAGIAVW